MSEERLADLESKLASLRLEIAELKENRPSTKIIYKAVMNFLVNDMKIRDQISGAMKEELSKGLSNFLKWNDSWVRGLVRAHLGAYTAELLKSKWSVKIEPQITIQETK